MNVFRVDHARKGVYYVSEFISVENIERMRFWYIALSVAADVLELFCSKFQELGVDLKEKFGNEIDNTQDENMEKEDDNDIYPIATYECEIRSSIPLAEVTHKPDNYFAPMFKSLDYNPIMLMDLSPYEMVLEDTPFFTDFDYIDDDGKIVHRGIFNKNNIDHYEVSCVQSYNLMDIDENNEANDDKVNDNGCTVQEPQPSTSAEINDIDLEDDNMERPQNIRGSRSRMAQRKRKGHLIKNQSSEETLEVRSVKSVLTKEYYLQKGKDEIYSRAQQMRQLKSKRVRNIDENNKVKILEINEAEHLVRIDVFPKTAFTKARGWLKYRYKEIDNLMYCSKKNVSDEQFERALTLFRGQDD